MIFITGTTSRRYFLSPDMLRNTGSPMPSSRMCPPIFGKGCNDPDKPYFSAWIRIYDIDTRPGHTSTFLFFSIKMSDTTPLYVVALCGFHDLVEHLINKCSQEVNVIGGFYVSPLVAALEMKHFEVAELLYQHGSHVDVQGHIKRTPLFVASDRGHVGIV